MSLALLQKKLSYLSVELAPADLTQLAVAAQSALERMDAKLAQTPAAELLILDLAYALVRNRLWLQHPLLHQSLAAFLTQRHQLPHQQARDFVSIVAQQAAKTLVTAAHAEFRISEKAFLIYLFVYTMKALPGTAVADELGMGDLLLAKLVQAAALFAECGAAVPEAHYFESDLDGLCYEVVASLTSERQQAAWCFDAYALYYLLADAVAPWWQHAARLAPLLVELLTQLGKRRSVAAKTWEAELSGMLQEKGLAADASAVAALIQHLERKDLILRRYGRSHGYSLSGKGYELSSLRFAELTKRSGCALPLASLHPFWQRALHA